MTGTDDDSKQVGGATTAQNYDAESVAAAARRSDPGLPPETALLLAGQAWERLRTGTEPDGPAVARALLADNPQAGATACNVVATAAVQFVAAAGRPPA